MKQNLMPKVVAAILLGSLFGWYIHHDYATWSLRGRDAFIAHQTRRFDMYMASPRPIIHNLVVTALLALGLCVLYELLVAGLSAIANRHASNSIEEDVR
jgi:hypothetical protein